MVICKKLLCIGRTGHAFQWDRPLGWMGSSEKKVQQPAGAALGTHTELSPKDKKHTVIKSLSLVAGDQTQGPEHNRQVLCQAASSVWIFKIYNILIFWKFHNAYNVFWLYSPSLLSVTPRKSIPNSLQLHIPLKKITCWFQIVLPIQSQARRHPRSMVQHWASDL